VVDGQVCHIRLLHWNAAEASLIKNILLSSGFIVDYDPVFTSALMRKWRNDPPWAFVIDLSRLPAHGREIAIVLRQSAKTRHIPIVFSDGAAEKVKLIRNLLPDATYCSSNELVKILKNLSPVHNPVQPPSIMNRYASRTAAQKLGITEGGTLTVVDPPRNVTNVIGELPSRVEFVEQDGAVTLCFVHSADDLRAVMSRVRSLATQSKLWFLWRKKNARDHAGVTEQLVRETGVDLGLVDYKICSVDSTWSAMLFARRK
jgi:hypothetical protein